MKINKFKRIIDSYIITGIERITGYNISKNFNFINNQDIPYDELLKLYSYVIYFNNIKKESKKTKKFSDIFLIENMSDIFAVISLLILFNEKDNNLYVELLHDIISIEQLNNDSETNLKIFNNLNKELLKNETFLTKVVDIFKDEFKDKINSLNKNIDDKVKEDKILENNILLERKKKMEYDELDKKFNTLHETFELEKRKILNEERQKRNVLESTLRTKQNVERENERLAKLLEDIKRSVDETNLNSVLTKIKNDELSNTNRELQLFIDELKNNIDYYNKQLEDNNLEKQKSNDLIFDLKNELSEKNNSEREVSNIIDEFNEKIDFLEKLNNDLNDKNFVLENNNVELQNKIDDKELMILNLFDTQNDLNKKINNYKIRINELNQIQEMSKTSNEELIKQVEGLNSVVKNLNNIIDNLTLKTTTLEELYNDDEILISEKNKTINDLETRCDEYEVQINEILDTNIIKEQLIDELETKCEEYERRIFENEETINSDVIELNKINDCIEEKIKIIKENTNKIDKLNLKIFTYVQVQSQGV